MHEDARERTLLHTKEAAAELDVSVSTIRRAIASGELRALRGGRARAVQDQAQRLGRAAAARRRRECGMRFARVGRPDAAAAVVEPREVRERRAQVKQVRLEVARRRGWTEIARERLVARGPSRYGWLVDAATDVVYQRYPGLTFEADSARLLADQQTFVFFVDEDGDVIPLEPLPGTWTERYGRQARTEARRAATS